MKREVPTISTDPAHPNLQENQANVINKGNINQIIAKLQHKEHQYTASNELKFLFQNNKIDSTAIDHSFFPAITTSLLQNNNPSKEINILKALVLLSDKLSRSERERIFPKTEQFYNAIMQCLNSTDESIIFYATKLLKKNKTLTRNIQLKNPEFLARLLRLILKTSFSVKYNAIILLETLDVTTQPVILTRDDFFMVFKALYFCLNLRLTYTGLENDENAKQTIHHTKLKALTILRKFADTKIIKKCSQYQTRSFFQGIYSSLDDEALIHETAKLLNTMSKTNQLHINKCSETIFEKLSQIALKNGNSQLSKTALAVINKITKMRDFYLPEKNHDYVNQLAHMLTINESSQIKELISSILSNISNKNVNREIFNKSIMGTLLPCLEIKNTVTQYQLSNLFRNIIQPSIDGSSDEYTAIFEKLPRELKETIHHPEHERISRKRNSSTSSPDTEKHPPKRSKTAHGLLSPAKSLTPDRAKKSKNPKINLFCPQLTKAPSINKKCINSHSIKPFYKV